MLVFRLDNNSGQIKTIRQGANGSAAHLCYLPPILWLVVILSYQDDRLQNRLTS